MPVFKNYNFENVPDWCAVKKVDRYCIKPGETIEIDTGHARAGIFVFMGSLRVKGADGTEVFLESGKFPNDNAALNTGKFTATFKYGRGYWLNQCEFYVYSFDWPGWVQYGEFRVEPVDKVENIGDPVDYYRNTNFDNHFHDYDEYWFVLRGSGVVQSEGILYEVEAGDFIATKRGDHHDFPVANSWVKCIGFKVRIGGPTRTGYLWEHTHGTPVVND